MGLSLASVLIMILSKGKGLKISLLTLFISLVVVVGGLNVTLNLSKTIWKKSDSTFHILENDRIIHGIECKQNYSGDTWYIKDFDDIELIHTIRTDEVGLIEVKIK